MRPKSAILDSPEIKAAFLADERLERLRTGKVACVLVIILMPLGSAMDVFSYPDHFGYFLGLRLGSSVLAAGLWYLHATRFGQAHYRWLGLPIALVPALFMCWMIGVTEGPTSHYYAALNLILLAVSVVTRWTFWESIASVVAILLMYLAVCSHPDPSVSRTVLLYELLLNVYFITLTGIIVVTGNYFFNQLRLREFRLRYELDANQRTLAEANRKLVELDQVKSRFFANISHELRTPLTLLLAPLETLLHDAKRSFDPQAREWLQTMYSNGLRLLKLINDLLDLVRLESGKMDVKREPVAMTEFVKGLVNSVRKVAEDRHVQLHASVDEGVATVMVDRDKLEKILLNLTFNALKFTPAGGRVEVDAARNGEKLVIRVRDTGVGIPADKLPFLFQRFWQADTSAQRKYQGAGIGLALVKELVEIQEGAVSVESDPGQGATFTVTLPYLPAERVEPAPPVPAAPAAPEGPKLDTEWISGLYRRAELFPSVTSLQQSLKPVETAFARNRPRVLIADDEPDMLRFLRSQLEAMFQVLEAVDGQQAVEKAAQFLPDIVLCDMMMPGKDGLQVCREIRQRTSTHSVPVLLITARADEETKLTALAAGASDFLVKPFSTTELTVRLGNLVESHQFQKKLGRQNQILESTIEQLKETETQLVAAEKMASLGRLSAGIMHEINNPLNFMKTGLHVLQAKGEVLPEDQRAEYAEILADLADGVARVQGIVAALRTFAHPAADKLDKVKLDQVVAVALKLLSNDLKDGVTVEQHLAADHVVWGNQNKLVQVLMNLVQNAAYAVKKKEFPNGDRPTVRIESQIDNHLDKVIVRDNGVGINPEDLGKVFEPFFTTKDVGEGMGLGLSICYRIIEEHEGKIRIQSEPGRFCEFTIELPRHAPA